MSGEEKLPDWKLVAHERENRGREWFFRHPSPEARRVMANYYRAEYVLSATQCPTRNHCIKKRRKRSYKSKPPRPSV